MQTQEIDYNAEIEMFLAELGDLIAGENPQTENEIGQTLNLCKYRLLAHYPDLRAAYAAHGYDAGAVNVLPIGYSRTASYWGKVLAARMFQLRDDLIAALDSKPRPNAFSPMGRLDEIWDDIASRINADDPKVGQDSKVDADNNPDVPHVAGGFTVKVYEPESVRPQPGDKAKYDALIPVLQAVQPGGKARLHGDNKDECKRVASACAASLIDVAGWHDGVPSNRRAYRTKTGQDSGGWYVDIFRLTTPVRRKGNAGKP